MHHLIFRRDIRNGIAPMSLSILSAALAPTLTFAQASPFMTGATALQTNILAWLTPVAIILVMVLGAMAMANRMSWAVSYTHLDVYKRQVNRRIEPM